MGRIGSSIFVAISFCDALQNQAVAGIFNFGVVAINSSFALPGGAVVLDRIWYCAWFEELPRLSIPIFRLAVE